MFTRSDMDETQQDKHSKPDAFLPRSQFHSSTTTTTTTSVSLLNSLPSTPRRLSPAPVSVQAHNSQSTVGLLTPSSSKASLSPAFSRYKEHGQQPPSPAPSSAHHRKLRHPPPNRRLFFPVRASLELFTRPSSSSAAYMPEPTTSRPGSPVRRSRAMSPRRPDHNTRPPSRCESLLRDTLRRADQQERSLTHRTMSRSPVRLARGRSRPRGNSFLEAFRREDSPDSDCDVDDLIQHMNEGDAFNRRRAQAITMRGRGAMSSSSTDAGSLPYGSPSSPSPLPPSMTRTRTAPNVPRARGRTFDDEKQQGASPLPLRSPQSGRRSLPNTVSHSHASAAPSNDASPKQRMSTLSPHESVLRAKLEYVLQKTDDSTGPSHLKGRDWRNHQRTFSHGVTVVTSPPKQSSSDSSSPHSLASSSLSNSATDLARTQSMPSHRRDPHTSRSSPSSPPEPLTPPPTPPFNARTASEVCKRMDGYVSFASVEGLGEPPGLDIDSDDSEDGLRKLGRWLRMLPVPFRNGMHGPSEHDAGAGQVAVGRRRAGSSCSGSR